MKKFRTLSIFFAIVFLFTAVAAAAAHPLGNFSVNRYSHLYLQADGQIELTYIVDMAEIPTFRERQTMDLDGNDKISEQEQAHYLEQMGPMWASNLHLKINDNMIQWEIDHQTLSFAPGQGELPTLRMTTSFKAPIPLIDGEVQTAVFVDENYVGQAGWQEIVMTADQAFALLSASVPNDDLSQGLTNYPENWLESPPAFSAATFEFGTAGMTLPIENNLSKHQAETAAAVKNTFAANNELAELLTTALEKPGAVVIALFIALGLGAAHALTPGHGKTIVGAYLVGSRGTPKHAIFLGLTTTVTHTLGVFAFGLLVLFASQFILPEKLFKWLGVASGLLVVGIGYSLFSSRLRSLLGKPEKSHDLDEPEGYHTHFGIGHTHTPQREPGLGSLLALGVSGGLLPCPSALILLLSAIALNKIGLGLVLIVAFSIGLAGVLTAIGLTLVYANKLFGKLPLNGNGRLFQWVPTASALFITIAGIVITIQAFGQTLAF